MNQNKRTCLIGCSIYALLAALIATPILFCSVILPLIDNQGFRPNANRLERELRRDKETFETIVDYLLSLEHETISIWRRDIEGGDFTSIEMFAGLEAGRIPIDDEDAREAVARLFRRGYRSISKDGHAVVFLRWVHFEHGIGLVYSASRFTPSESRGLSFPIEVKQLSEEGWFFYHEHFSTWRSRQSSNR